MSPHARRFAGLALGLAALGCGKDRSATKLTLRYHPPAGASYHYALEQHNSMKLEGGPLGQGQGQEQKFTTRMYFTQSVGRPARGGIAVTIRFDSTTLESSMMPRGSLAPVLDGMRGLMGQVVYDDRMNVLHAEFGQVPGLPPQIMDQLSGHIREMVFPLPDQPVGVGDSWSTETALPMGEIGSGTAKARTKLTVKELNASGPDTTILLVVETTLPGDPITVSGDGEARRTLKLSGGLAGEQLFSVTRGAAVRSSMGGSMRVKVSGGPQGAMEMSLQHLTSLQLSEAK